MSNNEKYVCINCVEQTAEKDAEIERLHGLLKKCQPYIAGWTEARELFSEIKKEVGDD